MDASEPIVVWGIGTPRTFRVYWALHELGLPYTSEAVRTRSAAMDTAEFLSVSPGKKIPALVQGELVLTESGAITRYLMDNYSTEQWNPIERAQINRWSLFALMEIDATALYVIRKHEGLPAIYGESPAAVKAAYEYADRQIAVVDAHLGAANDYVLGARFSEADIHLGTCFEWAAAIGMTLPSRLTGYLDRLRGREAYQQAGAANGPPLGAVS